MLSALEADRNSLATIDVEILRLEHSLSELRTAKTALKQRLDSYKYPVLTLPNEIVSEIFMHFVPKYPCFPPLTGKLSPNILTQICRRWRELALATPPLWSAISLSDNDMPFARLAHICDIWLSRSRACPLAIQFQFDEDDYRVYVSQALAAVCPHRARWECVKLYISQSDLPTIQGRLPLLRHLDLEVHDDPPTTPVTFRDVPMLRGVVINDIAASSVILPWEQLTSVTLNRVYLREFVPVLQQTPKLVHCRLHIFFSLDDDSDPQINITLPCLESLALNDPGYDQPVTKYLGIFILPALRNLKVAEQFLGSTPIDSLTSFISKSGCTLQEVHIIGGRSVQEDPYRDAFPSIPKFSFTRR
ncbi:hypothetical protein B0H13DRAFT_126558 [Mycena leptocephala]|nr:hypothetical protein B0H13DRAFT_126558 [Mycena leptocephala]